MTHFAVPDQTIFAHVHEFSRPHNCTEKTQKTRKIKLFLK